MLYDLYGMEFEIIDNHYDLFKPETGETGECGMVEEMQCFIKKSAGRKCFIDIGSCLGIFSLVFASTPGKVAYAVEPSPWAFPKLIEVLELNPSLNIHARQIFLGSNNGRKIDCVRDWYHVVAAHNIMLERVGKEAEKTILTETTLDSLCERERIIPDCLKIDVEGYEVEVLKGSREVLNNYYPIIFLEVHEPSIIDLGGTIEQLYSILRNLGYKIYNLEGKRLNSFHNYSICRYFCEA